MPSSTSSPASAVKSEPLIAAGACPQHPDGVRTWKSGDTWKFQNCNDRRVNIQPWSERVFTLNGLWRVRQPAEPGAVIENRPSMTTVPTGNYRLC